MPGTERQLSDCKTRSLSGAAVLIIFVESNNNESFPCEEKIDVQRIDIVRAREIELTEKGTEGEEGEEEEGIRKITEVYYR